MASVIPNKSSVTELMKVAEEQRQNELRQKTEPMEKPPEELQQALVTILEQDVTIAELKLQNESLKWEKNALTEQVDILKQLLESAERLDKTAARMESMMKEKSSADEILRADLETWSERIGRSIASRMYKINDKVLHRIQETINVQLEEQENTMKEINNQSAALKESFRRFFILYGWKEIAFWGAVILVAVSAALSIFTISKVVDWAAILG